MELHLKIIGWLFMGLAFLHLDFARRFNWKKELSNLSLINKEMMYIHTFFIALAIALMGFLCLSSYHELASTILGKRVCFGLGIFWSARLIVQFFGYSAELWKGKKFETTMHIAFSFLWVYLSAVFLYTAFA